MNNLPNEILYSILLNIEYDDILSLELVCKQLNELFETEQFAILKIEKYKLTPEFIYSPGNSGYVEARNSFLKLKYNY